MIRLLPIVAALLFLVPGETRALSCAPPQFDADAIEKLDIIFAGLVEKKRSPTLWRRIKSAIDNNNDGEASIYTFRITQVWKGRPIEGDRVEVIALPGWGQDAAYQVGEDYLVFGEIGDDPGRYASNPGWCGFDLLPREEVMRVLEQYRSHKNRSVHDREYPEKVTIHDASELRNE